MVSVIVCIRYLASQFGAQRFPFVAQEGIPYMCCKTVFTACPAGAVNWFNKGRAIWYHDVYCPIIKREESNITF